MSNSSCPLEADLRFAVGATRAYFTPIIVVTGILGNIATLIIFTLEARLSRWNRFGIYCSALAVSDAGVLLVSGLLDDFLGRGLMHATGRAVLKLDTVSVASCKLLEFLQNYFLFVSAHLLLAFTVDRLLGVWRPLRFAARGCVRETVGAVLAVCVAGLALNAPAAVVYDVAEEWHSRQNDSASTAGQSAGLHLWRTCHVTCNATTENRLANFAIYYKGFGIFVVPFGLQVALSAALLYLLLRARRRRRELLSPTSSPGSGLQDSHRIELSRYYANLALSLASCLLAAPLCVAIVMRANCGVCNPRDSCWCRYLAQLTKLLDSVQDASFAAGFWVYLACVASFRQRVAFAGAVVCLSSGCISSESVNRAPVRRAEELLTRSQRRRRPGAYASSLMQKRRSGSHVGGNGGSAGGDDRKTVEMQPLNEPNEVMQE
ncbi:hypothetical protein BOX15_Mlig003726g1 [Macrostomum lignano]|uniref:G-protein coupled receptors family 1 profile domain-containing protein n=1 Tax=Macrostomum lignano TaxID=282301 RepID=A0A267GW74_9PLAT|nr:hypothetical protein BOX15_Mlig003726g1 [Macrostomum lignano]